MRRDPGKEPEGAISAEELLRRASTDGEFLVAVRAAAEEGDYRLLVRVVRNRDNEYPRSARGEAVRLTREAIRTAIRFASAGSETGDALRLAQIMDTDWMPPDLRVEAWLGLRELLRNNYEALLAQIEHSETHDLRQKHFEFVKNRAPEAPAKKKLPR